MKNKSNLLFLLFTFCSIPQLTYSQKLVKASGTAQMELTEDISRMTLKAKLVEMATVDALEKAFGRVVIQGNATYISNLQTGAEVQTNTVFNTIANTSVKGEVEEVLSTKFTDIEGFKTVDGKKEPVIEIRCDIEIKAREIVTPPVAFTSYTLACTNEKCKTTSFRDGDDFFLYFSSPSSGYLSVFLDEKTTTQCLLPYNVMPSDYEGGVPVAADKKYILFSDKAEFDYFSGEGAITDTYQLYSNSSQDMNRLFIVFSKTPLNKPALSEEKEIENKYHLPRSLSSEGFQRWLNNYRSSVKENVQVSIVDITITR